LRKEVQIQIPQKPSTHFLIIPHTKNLHIFMPHNLTLPLSVQTKSFLTTTLVKDQPEQPLKNPLHASNRALQREKLRYFLLVNSILLLEHHLLIVQRIPQRTSPIPREAGSIHASSEKEI
jgi:hypothetical protein